MHRRRFLATSAALLMPASPARAFQETATPAATPAHHGRPRPIVLGDGIELIDYRIYPSTDVPRIIGEIISTRDDMVDSPVISITFPELGEDGRAYAPPALPVMRPGESNMIFGVLPTGIGSETEFQLARFGLCEPVHSGPATSAFDSLLLEVQVTAQLVTSTYIGLEGRVHNRSSAHVQVGYIQFVVRDSSRRLLGALPPAITERIVAHGNRAFEVALREGEHILADPRPFITDSGAYEVNALPGIPWRFVNPGCPSILL